MARGKKENVIEMNRQDEKDIRTYTFEDALDVTENNMKPDGYDINSSQKSLEVNDGKNYIIQTIKSQEGEKVYTYDEAIDLAGVGMYIYVMVAVLACALEAMALDMFGLSIVVSSACDLNLSQSQKSILLSMPFIGSVLMSYPWGYIADTQGRLKGLRFALWGSFILGSISAFSPNSIVLGILRFSSTSLSSGIHSLSLTLLGESCSSKIKGAALIGVTTLLIFTFGIYSALGYLVLSLEFSVDLGFIVFTPWRLLTLVLALPLGILALCTLYFVESPKFLLNAGDEKLALILLRKIGERNGVKVNQYPVKRVVLNESTPLRKDVPLLQSLKDQIVPIFKPPLVYRAIQLLFITGVIYGTNNGFYSWLPFVADTLTGKIASDSNVTSGNLCELISNYKVSNNSSTCIATVSEFTMWMGLVQGAAFSFLNLGISMLSNRKKTVLISMLLTSFFCAVAIPFAPGTILNLSLFFGYLITSLCSSISFSYFVDLFPTSYRGMAACLGVMTARISALAGVNLVGYYLVSNCANSLFAAGAVVMSGVIASAFLPADKPKIK